MKIIVTGGAGFIGSHLVESLVGAYHEVTVFDNLSTGKRSNLDRVKDKINFSQVDLSIQDEVYGLSGKVDVIFHLAALPRVQLSIDKPRDTHNANVNGIFNILEFARKKNVKKFIYASSSSVYGDQKELPLGTDLRPNPLNPYAMHKYIGELYCDMYNRIYGIETTSLRFFNVYGSRMATEGAYKLVFSNWIESIKKGEKMKIFGDGNQTRDFTHVRDVVNGLLMAMNLDHPQYKVFNIGSGVETSVKELAEMFGYPYEHVDARPFEEQRKCADISMSQIYGYQPLISLETGIQLLKEEYDI